MSDTAWKKQLKKFIPVLYEVVSIFMNPMPQENETYLVDATEIPVEGGKVYSARLHTCYGLANQMIDQIVIGEMKKILLTKFVIYLVQRKYMRFV